MRIKYIYPIALIAMFIGFVTEGEIIFRGEIPATAPKKPEIRYISPHVNISPYDHHFRNVADSLGWDWKLIAAIAFTESRFDSTATSEAGACGVMQMMPSTLRGMNIPDSLHLDTKTNIDAAGKLLGSLNHLYRRIDNFEERSNFILASYNAGAGHIGDAMNLAQKHGKARYIWHGHVDTFLILKGEPEFYTDSVCKNGSFSDWRQTLSFVRKVKRTWGKYKKRQEAYSDSIGHLLKADTTLQLKRQ